MSQFSLNLMPERRVWTVSDLTAQMRALLEAEFYDFWVEGEVSNCHQAQSGHLYFTLKDPQAQIRCVCFREQARYLKFRPEDGLHISLRGSIGIYEQRGEYQIYVSHIEPVGLGALQLAFDQLKRRLQSEGLFEADRKRPLPALPRRIGLITSPTGAAVRDVLNVLQRRFPNLHVLLLPVRVQGEGAAGDIVQALRYFNRTGQVDVILLARGGGSLEDLWAFNEEAVARAISASEIPVITGVGHESDFTIADFVADVRAPTPSAAAELVVRMRQDFERHIAEHQKNLITGMRYLLLYRQRQVQELGSHRSFRRLGDLLRRRRQHSDELGIALARGLHAQLEQSRRRLSYSQARIASFDLRARAHSLRSVFGRCTADLNAALQRKVAKNRRALAAAQVRLASVDLRARTAALRRRFERGYGGLGQQVSRFLRLQRQRFTVPALQLQERSPFHILERGYAIAYDTSGNVLRSPSQVRAGDDIRVRLARGELDAIVKKKAE